MLVDTHCHIHFRAYKDDRDEVIQRAREARVFMITVGTERNTSEDAINIAAKFGEDIRATVGLHPHHLFEMPVDENELAGEMQSEEFDYSHYRDLAKNPLVVGIGEYGPDYHRLPDNPNHETIIEKQKQVFRKHLDLADELQLPVVIHCRDAHEDMYEILKEYINAGRLIRRGVMHCFTAGRLEARKYLGLGFYIAFGGVITFKSKRPEHTELLAAANETPLDHMLIETDAPYLAPEPFRGKRNEPVYVRHVAERIAALKNIDAEEVREKTTRNAARLFNLPFLMQKEYD